MSVRVAVVEDNPRYRHGLETFFRHAPGYELAATFGSAEAALAHAEESGRGDAEWDLVLMDIELPGIDGIEATGRLKRTRPGLLVVVLTVFEDPAVILQAIRSGADGYLLKKTSAREMLAQLGAIAGGGAALTPGVARTVLDLLRARGGTESAGAAPSRLDLTEREQDVLRCLVQGKSYKQAAAALDIGVETVRTHVKAVYRKLQVHNVAEAIARARDDRLV